MNGPNDPIKRCWCAPIEHELSIANRKSIFSQPMSPLPSAVAPPGVSNLKPSVLSADDASADDVDAAPPLLEPLLSAELPCPSLAPVTSDPPKSDVAPPRSSPPHADTSANAPMIPRMAFRPV